MQSEIYIKRESLCEIGIGEKSWREGQSLYEETMDIVRICQNGLFGLEIEGKEILPPIYSSIYFFGSEFDGTTIWIIVEKENKYGLLECDKYSSTFCVEIIYDEITKIPNNDRIELRCGKWKGIYDLIAKRMIIPCQYNNIAKMTYGYLVELDGLKGAYIFYSRDGACPTSSDYSIPCLYDHIEYDMNLSLTNGIYSIFTIVRNGHKGICSFGKESIPPIYDSIEKYSDNIYRIYLNENVGLYGGGKEIVPPKYDKIETLSRDIYKVYVKDKVGLYYSEKEIVPPEYEDITCESRGIILRKGFSYGIVTNKYKIIEPQYEDIEELFSIFYAYRQSGKWGIVDEGNTIILSPQFQAIYPTDMIDDEEQPLFRVKTGLYWGIINLEGSFIIPAKYDYISTHNGIIYVRKGRNKYKLDNGEEFVKKIDTDYSCGYIDDSLLFEYDCNLMNLFDTDKLDAPTPNKNAEIATDELPF